MKGGRGIGADLFGYIRDAEGTTMELARSQRCPPSFSRAFEKSPDNWLNSQSGGFRKQKFAKIVVTRIGVRIVLTGMRFPAAGARAVIVQIAKFNAPRERRNLQLRAPRFSSSEDCVLKSSFYVNSRAEEKLLTSVGAAARYPGPRDLTSHKVAKAPRRA